MPNYDLRKILKKLGPRKIARRFYHKYVVLRKKDSETNKLVTEKDAFQTKSELVFYLPRGNGYDQIPELFQSDYSGNCKVDYVLCFTARSGSTALRSAMGKTGLLGEPMEFFNPRSSLYNHISKSKAKNVVDYMNYLKSTFSTGRDLFGFKTNFFDFHPFIQSGVYKKIFRGTKFIFLTRENVIAQAISLYLASKKDVWHKTKTNSFIGDSSKEKMDIPFDSQRILSCMNNLIHEKANWEYFFQVADIEPLYLTYERMFADFKGTIYKISDFLGTQLDEDTLIETDFVKISNEVNESFKHQILEQWKIGPDNRLLNSSVKSLDKDVHV